MQKNRTVFCFVEFLISKQSKISLFLNKSFFCLCLLSCLFSGQSPTSVLSPEQLSVFSFLRPIHKLAVSFVLYTEPFLSNVFILIFSLIFKVHLINSVFCFEIIRLNNYICILIYSYLILKQLKKTGMKINCSKDYYFHTIKPDKMVIRQNSHSIVKKGFIWG